VKKTSLPTDSVPKSTVWFMAAATGVIVANIYYMQPLLADIARAFGLSVTKAGAVAMVGQLGTALGMLLFVPLGDTREKRGLITIMLLGAFGALVLVASSRNALWLSVACFLVGAMGSTVHIFVPFAAHLAPPRERGRVVGTVFSGILLGILLARTFSGFVGAYLGWHSVFEIAAGMMLLVAILVQFFLPRSKPTVNLSYISLMRSTVGLVRSHPALRESAFIGASIFCCFSAFWTTLIFLLESPPFHYGSQAAGLFGLVGAAGAAGAPFIGRLTDKHGPRFTIGFALGFVFFSFILLGLTGKTLAGLIVGVLALDLGVQAGHVANQTRIYNLDSQARSRLNMFYMVCYFTGGSVGSLLGAWAWRVGGWFGVCAFCLAVISLTLLRFAFSQIRDAATVHAPTAEWLEPEP
jgi:predicted MFS family arabinose efflux permease